MNTILAFVTFVTTYGPQIVQVGTALVSAASVINTMIPPGKPGTTTASFKQVINVLSVGLGHASPAGMPPSTLVSK